MGVIEKPRGESFDNGPAGPDGQYDRYAVLPSGERKQFVRPYRDSYVHETCGTMTRMGPELSETYAADPTYYGRTFCVQCRGHFPVREFTWAADGQVVGS